jgi:hypothetical protein
LQEEIEDLKYANSRLQSKADAANREYSANGPLHVAAVVRSLLDSSFGEMSQLIILFVVGNLKCEVHVAHSRVE